MNIKTFSLLLAIIVFDCFFVAAQLKPVQNGKVKGTIYDSPTQYIVTSAEVTIEGEGIKRTFLIAMDFNLEYEFNVPAGIYNITTKQDWLYAVKRASFYVEAGKTKNINLYPSRRIESIALTLDGDRITYSAPPKYAFLKIDNSGADLLVKFYEQKSGSTTIKYKGAQFTFDALTVLADKIIYNKKRKTFKFIGDVLIDDNDQRTKAKKAEIRFKNGKTNLSFN
ncbi:MAG TPA: hypothetical protein VF604_14340 [Pyrinomonadaceae bacterium]|jgi:hypothetical protein